MIQIGEFEFFLFTSSFFSITRKIFPPISLIISSSVQFPDDNKYSINFGYFDTSSSSFGVLRYLHINKSNQNNRIHT